MAYVKECHYFFTHTHTFIHAEDMHVCNTTFIDNTLIFVNLTLRFIENYAKSLWVQIAKEKMIKSK